MELRSKDPLAHPASRGKTIVVTCGTGVLGEEIACGLAGLDANVVLLDRNLDPAARLLEYANSCAGRALAVYADALSMESLQQASETIMREFGQVDGLVNAAGGNKPEATTNPEGTFFDLPAVARRWVLDFNIVGTVLPCQVFGKDMARRGQGVIVNFSSMSAFRPLTRIPAYSAAIRVTAIAPGFFLTHQNRFLHTPMKRFGKPTGVLATVFWLLSPLSEFVTGAVAGVKSRAD